MAQTADQFMALSQFKSAGDERQRRLQDLRAMWRGGRYATVKTPSGGTRDALDWDAVGPRGDYIPVGLRQPATQMGTTELMMDTLMSLFGFPTFRVTAPGKEDSDSDGNSRAQQRLDDILGEDQLNLEAHSLDQVADVAGVGAAVFGFHRPKIPGRTRTYDYIQRQVEWCERLTVAQALTDRAQEVADELAAAGVPLKLVKDIPTLPVPQLGGADELLWVRVQWPVEVTQQQVTWARVDYTAHAIVEWEAVTVTRGQKVPPKWRLKESWGGPHGWGFVPLVWVVGKSPEEGATEGQSIYSEAVQSLTREADYTGSVWRQNVRMNCIPQAVEVDLEDPADGPNALDADGAPGATVDWIGHEIIRRESIPDKAGQVALLETTGAAAQAADRFVEVLTDRAHEVARVIRHDPKGDTNGLSGEAQKQRAQPTQQLLDLFRGLVGRGYRRLARKLLWLEQMGEQKVDLTWPDVFKPTAQDLIGWAQALAAAVQGGFLSIESATLKFAQLLGVDPTTELKRLQDGEETALDRARKTMGGEGTDSDQKGQQGANTPQSSRSQAPGDDDLAATAMNGAQVKAMIEIVESVALGQVPREAGVMMLSVAFGLTPVEADKVMGEAGRSFTPTVEPTAPPVPEGQPTQG